MSSKNLQTNTYKLCCNLWVITYYSLLDFFFEIELFLVDIFFLLVFLTFGESFFSVFTELLLAASMNSFSICFFTFLNFLDDIMANIMANNKKNQYTTALIHITLQGADHSGWSGHWINEVNKSRAHAIKIIGIIYENNSLQKYHRFLFVVSFIFEKFII